MSERLLSRRDLRFLLYEWLQVEALTQRPRFAEHSRETFEAALDAAERIATDHFAPINRRLDLDEPRFDGERVHTPPELGRALRALVEGGFIAATHDFELGGMQLPLAVASACFAYFDAASIAATAYPFLTIANANLLLAHGTPEQIERYARPQLAGRFFGTMCLSEPQAGSSLGDIRTRALPQPDGSHRLFGHKMWISGGEHDLVENIVHLVLAKIPLDDGSLPPGVDGISLFVVPKRLLDANGNPAEPNDVALAGLNHKMGYRGTTNCLLNFGEGRAHPRGAVGAIGWLVGDAGRGLAAMFHMMNEARIGVGLGAVALGYTGYLQSLEYARSRPQGRRPSHKDPRAPQVPIVEHADVRRMLLAQKAYVEGALALSLYCARLVDEQHGTEDAGALERARWMLDLLTPVAKSWPSQWCLEANSLAIQIHGGYGYTRDYNVEQLYRDNRLNPIHEGTHGIQAIDLLGRKLSSAGGRAFDELRARVSASVAAANAAGEELAALGNRVEAAFAAIAASHDSVRQRARDREHLLANASVFLEAFGHAVIAWMWLEQALVAHAGEQDDFRRGKLQAARYFVRCELPRIEPMLALVAAADPTSLEMRDEWF